MKTSFQIVSECTIKLPCFQIFLSNPIFQNIVSNSVRRQFLNFRVILFFPRYAPVEEVSNVRNKSVRQHFMTRNHDSTTEVDRTRGEKTTFHMRKLKLILATNWYHQIEFLDTPTHTLSCVQSRFNTHWSDNCHTFVSVSFLFLCFFFLLFYISTCFTFVCIVMICIWSNQ